MWVTGWYKLHRKITESPIFSDPDILRLWILCLSKATHKGSKVIIEKKEIELQPGQFLTGRFSLHEEYNKLLPPRKRIPDITLWRWLKSLEEWGNLNIRSTNKYSVVTVSKWDEYQEVEQQVNNTRTTGEQHMNTNKNVKKEKNDKNKEEELIFDDMPHVKIQKKQFEKLIEILGSEEKAMTQLYGFASWILRQPPAKQKSASAYLSITAWHRKELEKQKQRTVLPFKPQEKKEKEVELYFRPGS